MSRFPSNLAHWACAAAVVGADEPDLILRIVESMIAKGYPALKHAAAMAYDPLWAYEGGAVGPYYNQRIISSLWQDTARTIPVENTGDIVACVDDLHGSLHLKNADPAKCPLYDKRTGRLFFDGVDDYLRTDTTLDLTGHSKVTVACAMEKAADDVLRYAMAFGPVASAGSFFIPAPPGASNAVRFLVRGASSNVLAIATPVPAGTRIGMLGYADLLAPKVGIEVGSLSQVVTTATGITAFSNQTLTMGANSAGSSAFYGYVGPTALVAGSISIGHHNALSAWSRAMAGAAV